MNLDKSRFTQLIKSASFKELFNELGWDKLTLSVPVSIDDEKFQLNTVAEKRGFVIFVCSPDSSGKIPISSIRKKIDQRIAKLYYEHLIIYTDKNNTQQIWQLVLRESDKPIIVRETPYFNTQHPELLFQKLRGLFISLDDEEKVTIADVRSNVREQFNTNAEKVTKKFYTEFKAQHTAFLKFIEGIEDKVSQDWYASLMLNRLMFIYFIQKKGFLDNNLNYLSDKLKETKKKKGDNKFYSFYRSFLLILFHQGLGAPERPDKLLKEIGKVPYLNGGLFDVHQIEKEYKKIEIEDKAFEKIFKFFDEYNWHLDTKMTATGKDINPDVIGYIFEKYINDRAAMGAYYTKEDITEYIAKNTIIPFLFDEAKKGCKDAFENESSLWHMLQQNPDRYIYDSVKHGIYKISPLAKGGETEGVQEILELPKEIQIGLDTTKPNLLERRKEWNKPAPPEFALPTEIWREVVERRNRYFNIKYKIVNGEIKEINDFITYNLNIRQFAQDAVHQYEGSDFINVFYKAITKITVLDPTCGSGAFLFAALNILEPLYYECIQRMKVFAEEDDKQGGKKFTQFRKILEEINHHPNEKYYIYKSIILNNLYGVDIMNEAVEIAKLRLFLKLVAEVEDFDHLEPLPDIDFNVRCGNTLIGFATKTELENGLKYSFDYDNDSKKINDELFVVANTFKHYKEIQLEDKLDHPEFKKSKDELNDRLKKLNETLNDYLGNDYGKSRRKKKEFDDWLKSHQPFHWFAEFYEIIENGGFDVIIGNPPYVDSSKIEKVYRIKNFKTKSCGNLYAYISERCLLISNGHKYYLGLIIPLSGLSIKNFEPLQRLFYTEGTSWSSFYSGDRNPAELFTGVKVRAGIIIKTNNKIKESFCSRYMKWYSNERGELFQKLIYYIFETRAALKINSRIFSDIYKKIDSQNGNSVGHLNGHKIIYYHAAPISWSKSLLDISFLKKNKLNIADSYKQLNVDDNYLSFYYLLLNSSLFFVYWISRSDCYNLTKNYIYEIKCPYNPETDIKAIDDLAKKLQNELDKNAEIVEYYYKNRGKVRFAQYYPSKSKTTLDEVDSMLANIYGFTEEELDFIINYDIKYRMGKELEEE